jgi:uncharacterized protein with von Willebrand factor type A (vWA) domain
VAVPAFHSRGDLAANIAAFCDLLRREHGFVVGPGEAIDALRAVEAIGLADRERAQSALRLVLCASAEQIEVFDRAFDAFFLPAPRRGARQHNLHSRHTRPHDEPERAPPGRPIPSNRQGSAPVDDGGADLGGPGQRRYPVEDEGDGIRAWRLMQARYSAAAAQSEAPDVPRDGLNEMLEAAGLLVRRLRLGRSLRWRSTPTGPRFDFRRTFRASLQTGGEPLKPRWLAHPRRNPRVVVIVDGSRSMSEHAGLMLQFAYALSRRTRRLDAFVFSTGLEDVTRQLRRFRHGQTLRLSDLADAWGGGTRIGECLERLVREFGYRCLTADTLVLILSDGLDVGEPELLQRAMREVRRRCALLVWLNPLLSRPGYTPSSRGMQAALPHIDLFAAGGDSGSFKLLAHQLRT